MELPKDVYLYLMNFGDDKTILNMLSVNKKFDNEDFFKTVLERKYPLITSLKTKKETWRSFYVKMIFYIAKLKERYDFPYFPLANPETIYKGIRFLGGDKEYVNDTKLALATSSGNIEIINKYLDNKIGNPSKALRFVDLNVKNQNRIPGYNKNKSLEITKLLVEKGKATGFYEIMRNAAANNNREILEYLIPKGGSLKYALYGAVTAGNIDLAKYLISKGANDIRDALGEAARIKKINMIEFLGPYASQEEIKYVFRNAIGIGYGEEVINTLRSLLNQ
jgi:hypothetical protein